MEQAHTSFLETVSRYFDRAAALTQHPKGLLEQIKICNSVYSLFLRRGNGAFVIIENRLAGDAVNQNAQGDDRKRDADHITDVVV